MAKESFAELLEESLGQYESLEGAVVEGRVISIDNDMVLIDVGLKPTSCRTGAGRYFGA